MAKVSRSQSNSGAGSAEAAKTGQEIFLAVSMTRILVKSEAISDLFVRLPNGKMIKFAHKGDKIDADRVERYRLKSHGDVMYVSERAYSGVVQELIVDLKRESENAGLTDEELVERYFSIAGAVLSEVVKLPITEAAVVHATMVVEELSLRLVEPTDLSKALRVIFTLSDKYAQDAMVTVMISNWLARELGWSSARLLHPLTLGAMLHDIGLKELPPVFMEKGRWELSAEELGVYETHPERGAKILGQFSAISPEVLQIVREHHEQPNGLGFPLRLRGERMFTLAKAVSFANVLGHDILETLIATKEFSADRLIERIDHVYKPMYGAELCKAMRSVFKARTKTS